MLKVHWTIIPLLIALVILPRLSIDLYLPALPSMAISLHTTDFSLQMTLTVFMLGYALSVLIAGPLSDILGRKRVMFFGICIYLISTIICATTSSIFFLIIARFFQALGGCCGTVIARVMVRDVYDKTEQIHILAYLSAAMAVCPLIVPIVGGYLQVYFGWRISFYILALFSLLLLVFSNTKFKDPFVAKKIYFHDLMNNYKMLFQHRLFLGYSLTIGFAWCDYFAFTLESPFIFEKMLKIMPSSFGFILAGVVLGYLIGTIITKRYANGIGWDKLILIATSLCIFGSILLVFLIVLLSLSWPIIMFPMMIIMMGVGIIIPCTQAAVMQPFSSMAGTASGLFFFIQMTFGAICGFIIQTIKVNSAAPMAFIILTSSLLLLISFYTLIWRNNKESLYETV